jgi:hypothetical protein
MDATFALDDFVRPGFDRDPPRRDWYGIDNLPVIVGETFTAGYVIVRYTFFVESRWFTVVDEQNRELFSGTLEEPGDFPKVMQEVDRQTRLVAMRGERKVPLSRKKQRAR